MDFDLEFYRDLTELALDHATFVGIATTLGFYVLATKVYAWIGSPACINPLFLSILLLSTVLYMGEIPYELYFRSAEPLHLLLNVVVVLLAVPLWRQLDSIQKIGLHLVPVLIVGAATGIATSAGLAYAMGLPSEIVSTLAPKSVTTPVAIQLSQSLGGIPTITAVVVILTGLTGANFGLPFLSLCGLRDPRVQGFAMGVSSHAIGTARAFQVDEVAGTYSSLGMILNAIMTAVLISATLIVIG